MLAFEDTEPGVVSALAAGLRCIAVLGTMDPARLRAAERVVPELDPAIVREALGLPQPLISGILRSTRRGRSPMRRRLGARQYGDNETRSES